MNNTCKNCKKDYTTEAKYCGSCGIALSKSFDQKKISTINLIIAFYITFLIFSAVSYFLFNNYPNSFIIDLGVELLFAFLVILFGILDFNGIIKLYNFPKIDWRVYLFTIIFPIISSILVYFFMEKIHSFFSIEESSNYYLQYINYEYPFLWTFIFIAVLPPIFEELAFRGFLFNQLKKVANDNLTILATAFIFALVHFSFISFLWIFPFGLILGYLRNKFNTLWLGMIIHFIHNLIVILIDYFNVNYLV